MKPEAFVIYIFYSRFAMNSSFNFTTCYLYLTTNNLRCASLLRLEIYEFPIHGADRRIPRAPLY
jgi:hypothetical protein